MLFRLGFAPNPFDHKYTNGPVPPFKVVVMLPSFIPKHVGFDFIELTLNTGPGFKCATFTITLSLQPNVRSVT